jgi:hypothetical protein
MQWRPSGHAGMQINDAGAVTIKQIILCVWETDFWLSRLIVYRFIIHGRL